MNNRFRLLLGTILLICGLFCPLLIPIIIDLNIPIVLKGLLSSLLVFGIPELFIILAVALLGKDNYRKVEQKIKQILFKNKVSRLRYRIGLIFFTLPLVIGLVEVYIRAVTQFYGSYYYHVEILWTLMFALSFFILGSEFWQKCKALYNYESYVVFKEKE